MYMLMNKCYCNNMRIKHVKLFSDIKKKYILKKNYTHT